LITNIAVTVALLPMLFPNDDGGSGTAVAAGAGEFSRHLVAVAVTPSTVLVPTTTTTTTTAPPAPAAPKKVAVRRRAAKATTTTLAPRRVKAAPTTTAAPRPATASASGSESGRATWYDYKPGICAHRTLPFGTVVTVHASNGKSVQCTVGDRGPYVDGYVIDLHWREFEQLAPRSAGRIDCTISW
jgi:rare lipoprotein A (peptidoglycan hydrolase)